MAYTRRPLRGMRKIGMAFWTPPQDSTIYGSMQIDVTTARRFQDDVKAKHGVWPSIGQLVGKGVALALEETPDANAKIIWGRPYTSDSVDVYFQVDIGDGQDLSGVTVNDCARKSIVEVSTELREVANKLRKGEDQQYENTQKGLLGLLPVFVIRWLLWLFAFAEFNLGTLWLHKLAGARREPFGTVMVSNASKFGVDVAYAPLVPVSRVPFIVVLGRIVDTPWVVEGEVRVRPVITVNATFDHRLIDGNKIGRIVRRTRAYVEDPYAYEPAIGVLPPGAPPAQVAPVEQVGERHESSESG